MENQDKDQNIEVVKKGSEIIVGGTRYISKGRVDDNPLLTSRDLDSLVSSGKVRAFLAHGKTYYCEADLIAIYPAKPVS